MESVQGSWQYEALSSANETSYASSPSSPAMYSQMSPLADQGLWDDYSLCKGLNIFQDHLIGSGDQLLSSTGTFNINALTPPRVVIGSEIEDDIQPALYVDPNLIQPQPAVEQPAPVVLADLEEFLGETLDFTSIVPTIEQTEAQAYDDIKPESLNEASVNLGSPVAGELKPTVNFDDLITIDSGDIVVPESELAAVLGGDEAINFDQWFAMEEDEGIQGEESTSFDSSYEDSVLNENSYMDSSSQMSSALTSDAEDDAQEETIDALMRMDLPAAQAAIVNSNFAIPAVATFVVQQTKPERRGRKPSTSTSTKTWRNVKDKNLRKKQQNKLAATKYRQKKKEEAKISMVEENQMQAEWNTLTQEQQRLADKIRQVKELLKEKYRL